MQGLTKNFNGGRLAAALLCGGASAASFALSANPAMAATHKATPGVHALRAYQAAQASMNPSNDVTLDFVAADITDVLKALAVQTGVNIVASPDVKGTITVSLAHVTLDQALDMITRLSGLQYARANNAIIVGTPASIAQFTQPAGDADQMDTQIVPLHYASFDDASNLIKTRFPTVQIGPGTQVAGHSAGSSTGAIILSGSPDYVSQAVTLINSLEDSLAQRASLQTTETYTPHYVSLGDLIGVLNTLVPSLLVTPGPGAGFRATAPSAAASAASSSASASSDSSGSSSGSSGGSGTGASQSSIIGPSMILLTGSAADIAHARQILAQVDIKPAQILYEAKVTELDINDVRDLGLNWDFSTAGFSIGELVPTGYSTSATINPVNYPGQILKFGTFGRSPIFDLANVKLDALFTNGRSKLLSDPNIAALDGYPAQFFTGDTINYLQSQTVTTTGENIVTASVNVGVTLRVTGKQNPDGYITLNIHPEVSTVDGYLSTPGGGQIPNVATRFADTTVRVRDGQTIAIGGLIQDNDIVNITKVPFFGDLPFFGGLFRDTQHQHNRTEVVFFLKTSVMKDS